MTFLTKTTASTLALAGLLALGGCGGGGDDDGGGGGAVVGGTDVPVGVEQSIDDVIAFAKRLIAGTSESSEPVVLGNAQLATNDTAEPADL